MDPEGRDARNSHLFFRTAAMFPVVYGFGKPRKGNRSMTQPELSLASLRTAVTGTDAAIRVRTRLVPAGGPGDKVFPPTYQGGQYAREKRWADGRVVDVVLLDSVQSQANRMELALRAALERGEMSFPVMAVDFAPAGLPHIGRITSLDAPHRVADAVFRESLLHGVPFRDSELGRRFAASRHANATPLWELSPTALVFGVWDSTGALGGMGTKFARALVSEIVGFEANVGVKTASRVDPLPISASVEIYEAQEGKGAPGGWTLDPSEAVQERDKAKRYGAKGRPSEINLGNVTPDIQRDDDGNVLPGGVTISHAVQTTVLSLPALRRLRFPGPDGKTTDRRDAAARTVLAALALAGVAYLREQGYDLRSRCLLVPEEPLTLEVLPNDGSPVTQRFSLTAAAARNLFETTVRDAVTAGLPWPDKGREVIALQPSQALIELVRRSEALVRPSEG